jgi:ATP-dependent DNA helicase RecG
MEGTQQSGIALDLKISDLATDGAIVQMTRNDATEWLDNDPDLSSPDGRMLDDHIKFLFNRRINWGLIS